MFVGAAWAGPALRALTPDPPARVAQSAYVVRQGDTLWSIAHRLAKGEDPRPLVDAISAASSYRHESGGGSGDSLVFNLTSTSTCSEW